MMLRPFDGRAEWYSRYFLPMNFFAFVGYVPVVITVVALIAGGLHTLFLGNPISGNKIQISFIVEAIIVSVLFFPLKNKIFPRIGFDVGRSSSVINSARIWRMVVFSGICIGLGVAVVGGLMVEKLK